MTRACAHMLYVRSHICLYMFPCTLYIGVAGCQARASGDFAGGSHASSQVRNRIRFNNYHYVYLHIYNSPIYGSESLFADNPANPTPTKSGKPDTGSSCADPPPDRDVASLFPAGPGGVWSGRCTGRLQWCQVQYVCTYFTTHKFSLLHV